MERNAQNLPKGCVCRKNFINSEKKGKKMILVLLGTQNNDFSRLLREIEICIDSKVIHEDVIVQAGFTKFETKKMKIFDMIPKEELKELVEEGLIDYVAVDIKNAPKKYNKTIGLEGYRLDSIKTTVQYLLENHVDYEFRTTIIKEFHTENDMRLIGEWIKGARRYYLQNFEDNENVIQEGLHACSLETLQSYKKILEEYVDECEIRGIEERI